MSSTSSTSSGLSASLSPFSPPSSPTFPVDLPTLQEVIDFYLNEVPDINDEVSVRQSTYCNQYELLLAIQDEEEETHAENASELSTEDVGDDRAYERSESNHEAKEDISPHCPNCRRPIKTDASQMLACLWFQIHEEPDDDVEGELDYPIQPEAWDAYKAVHKPRDEDE